MEISSIAGSAMLMKAAQSQESIAISIMKLAAEQQNQIAAMLLQNAVQQPQSNTASTSSGFSIYA